MQKQAELQCICWCTYSPMKPTFSCLCMAGVWSLPALDGTVTTGKQNTKQFVIYAIASETSNVSVGTSGQGD